MSQQPPYSGQPSGQQSPYGGQPPGQQPGYDNPYQSSGAYQGGGMYTPGPPKRGGRGGKITFFIGLALLIVGIIATVGGGYSMFSTVSNIADGAVAGFTESAQIDANVGESYVLIAENPRDAVSCDVTGPDGSRVPVDTSITNSIDDGTTSTTILGVFTPETAGSHTVTCTGADGFAFAQMDITVLGVATLALVVGIFLGFIGFLVTVIGLIVWLIGRNKVSY